MNRSTKLTLLSFFLVCSIFWQASRAQKPAGTRPGSVDDAALRGADGRTGDWLTHGRTYSEARFSPLDQIKSSNVRELGLAWSFDTESTRGLEATPLVAGGVMYTTGPWSVVFALDARTGKLLWKWDPKVPGPYGERACCDVVNRGVALYKGKVYVGILDGRLAALDAATGKLLWQVTTVDQSQAYTITGAPRVVKGKVIIGNGGAEFGVRGYVSAYDAETGKLSWRFYTVPGDPSKPFESKAIEQAAKTWNGEWWKFGGGGTVWDSLAYDPELDLLYVGTGNGSPWNQNFRSPGGGDNLYLSSILALRPDSGELVWYYQTTPGESWDFTATQHMILADLDIAGRKRRVLMQAPKNGFFYVLDRATGELLSAEPYVHISWAKGVDKKTGRPIEMPGVRYKDAAALMIPGPLGGHNWQPMSYSPQTGLVYIPVQDNIFIYSQDRKFQYRPGTWNTAVDFSLFKDAAPPTPGRLLAWDPVTQKERWHVEYPTIWNGGTLSTAGNLVFQGTADGRLVAYSADKGEKLWEAAVGTGVIAAPITYELDGVQYVSVMAGWGGAFALAGGRAAEGIPAPGKLLTFALGGKATIADAAPQKLPAVTPIEFTASAEKIDAGAAQYARTCAVCHGLAAISGGATPDLRYSAPSTFDKYPDIVLEGEYSSRGMPSFKKWLRAEDVAAIRMYVLKRRSDLSAKVAP
ncbi:MAG TPA: PQQ-dependent dehydrogenase, methanol/ethanol family [Blastocatellia bacterium]|nr:PQQ-dependent dehydrogenase, methanol/ethanol family [Blastocatellia bacterium]